MGMKTPKTTGCRPENEKNGRQIFQYKSRERQTSQKIVQNKSGKTTKQPGNSPK